MFILDYSTAHRLFHSFFDVVVADMRAAGLPARGGRWLLEKKTNAKARRSKHSAQLWGFSWNACEHLATLPPAYFVIQTEPLVVREAHDARWPKLRALLRGAAFVWDYFPEGHARWYDAWGVTAFELPLRYSAGFARAMPLALRRRTPPGAPHPAATPDVLFYGCTSPRRDALAARLRAAGLSVTYGVIQPPRRDRLIAGAAIVLSSGARDAHAEGNVDAFRIVPLLSVGAFVVAEENPRARFFQILKPQGLACGVYADLPALCGEWVRRGSKARRAVTARLSAFLRRDFRMDAGFRAWKDGVKNTDTDEEGSGVVG